MPSVLVGGLPSGRCSDDPHERCSAVGDSAFEAPHAQSRRGTDVLAIRGPERPPYVTPSGSDNNSACGDLVSLRRGLALRKTRACPFGPGLHPEHPTAVEGCRPASRGLTLELLTGDEHTRSVRPPQWGVAPSTRRSRIRWIIGPFRRSCRTVAALTLTQSPHHLSPG